MNSLLNQTQQAIRDIARKIQKREGEWAYFGIHFSVAFVLLAYLFIAYFLTKEIPSLGFHLVIGITGFLTLLWLGPKFTFPLYFATWFGTALTLPGIPVSFNRVMALTFLASFLCHLPNMKKVSVPKLFPFFMLLAITLYGVMMNMIMKAPESSPSVQQIIYLFIGLAVFQTFRERQELVRLMKVLVLMTCLISSVGLFEFIFRTDLFSQFSDHHLSASNLRINGVSKNAIQFAFNATWMIPIALFLHVQAITKWGRIASLGALVFLILISMLTFNRQTPVIIGAMIFVGMLFIRYEYRKTLIVAMALVALAISPIVIGEIISRFSELGEGPPDASFAIRFDKFLVAKHIIADHWLFGIGINNFKDYWFAYKPRGELYLIHFDPKREYYIDLGYLQILTEMGVVGLCAFIVLILSSFRLWVKSLLKAMRLEDHFSRNLLAVLAMSFAQLLISNLIQDTFLIPRTFLLFFIFFMAITQLNQREKENANENSFESKIVGG